MEGRTCELSISQLTSNFRSFLLLLRYLFWVSSNAKNGLCLPFFMSTKFICLFCCVRQMHIFCCVYFKTLNIQELNHSNFSLKFILKNVFCLFIKETRIFLDFLFKHLLGQLTQKRTVNKPNILIVKKYQLYWLNKL